MAKNTKARHEDLRNRLLDLAEQVVIEKGLNALRARDLAKQANCSVGAIYTVFKDMNGLALQVNGRTFQQLGAAVAASVTDMKNDPPCERLVALSLAYLDFASENFNAWSSLFDIEMTAGPNVPEWYMNALADLFRHINAPVREIFPELSRKDSELMTRGLFSSIHGIVLLGLQRRISGVPLDEMARMITLILSNLSKNQKT
ncbi:MAG: TetR/AcrR family transcriptional regulator [Rhodobacteraceae bacterium]|nr:TetR/AcrR family transcriptional regulator [Paracoccaceae bacterium]